MTYRVVFTPTARADAIDAFRWIADRSPNAAARWYVGLEKAIAKLSTFPERHPIAEEDSEQLGIALRQMAYGRRRGAYRVLFSIQADTVYLHYVRHSARGPIEPGESR
ncbi:MAG: type II toxin-antitoxin system RelE/ParE family toxin [Isosphaeraceae bacterium]|nr:type II toxin-antitoxin system RelE/ParE family toxin [Isosphaeraceae bacterium]